MITVMDIKGGQEILFSMMYFALIVSIKIYHFNAFLKYE